MGLGIKLGSIVSVVSDKVGDSGPDAVVKIKRAVNECGPDFLQIADFPFLREDISFELSTSDYKHSGESYLPTTFKSVLASYLFYNNIRYNFDEVGIQKAYSWPNPLQNSGRPDEFCITRIESGYWEMQVNRLADQAYTAYLEIEKQWTDVSANGDEIVVTKPYLRQFSHFVAIEYCSRQGDAETLVTLKSEWWDPRDPKNSILGRMLNGLKKKSKNKRVNVVRYLSGDVSTYGDDPDYRRKGAY